MLNNQQKYFVKCLKKLAYSNWREIKLNTEQLSEEVAYLSKTYDVKFFKHMSWMSPYCVFNGKDFGRFHVRINAMVDGFYLYHPKHKHPHSWVEHEVYGKSCGKKYYPATCFGSHVVEAFL